jgi:hypothetical protein
VDFESSAAEAAHPMSKPLVARASANEAVPMIKAGLLRLQDDQRDRESERLAREDDAMRLKAFPDWPDDRRGVPNMLVRSAVFSMGAGGQRERVTALRVPAAKGEVVSITGWLMDQHHLDLWLELHHLCRLGEPGQKHEFTRYSILRALRQGEIGRTDYRWLDVRLQDLYETLLLVQSPGRTRGPGNLIRYYEIDRARGVAVIETNPNLRWLWEQFTHLELAQRRMLGRNQLAKALHASLATYPEWPPTRLDTLQRLMGSRMRRLRDFKADLAAVLRDFMTRDWITSYSFDPGADVDLVRIAKVPTPSQKRWLERMRTRSAADALAPYASASASRVIVR